MNLKHQDIDEVFSNFKGIFDPIEITVCKQMLERLNVACTRYIQKKELIKIFLKTKVIR
jgi:hypothetical protein